MKKKLLTLGLVTFALFPIQAQTLEGFESLALPVDTAIKFPASNQNDFYFGPLTLSNTYISSWDSFTGFAMSTITDNQTAGWENQFGTITGSGSGGSSHFAVLYDQGTLFGSGSNFKLDSIQISNSTYAYFSMLNGDQFAKKFGGVSGNDPDYLKLNIVAESEDGLQVDTIPFYLADYRFTDNTLDYIVNKWTTVHLASIGFPVYQLEFYFESSDTSAGWINTPTYANLDNIYYTYTASVKELSKDMAVYPNPFAETISLNGDFDAIRIFDLSGRLILEQGNKPTNLQLSYLQKGVYVLVTESNGIITSTRIEKR